eukprot:scaffold21740_cov21-Tisochrysis_lutea.AAC.4
MVLERGALGGGGRACVHGGVQAAALGGSGGDHLRGTTTTKASLCARGPLVWGGAPEATVGVEGWLLLQLLRLLGLRRAWHGRVVVV